MKELSEGLKRAIGVLREGVEAALRGLSNPPRRPQPVPVPVRIRD